MIVRTDIAAHLEQTARIGFTAGTNSFAPQRGLISQQITSSKAFELLTDLGDTPWPVQNGGKLGSDGSDARTGAQKTGDMSMGGQPTVFGTEERAIMVYPVDWEIAIGITHNAINDDQTGSLESWARGAAVNFQKHMDWLVFAALNGGDGTTYGKCYDGQNFYSNSHADPGAEYTTAQDNLNGSTLSLDNFKTIKIAASKFLNSRGKPMGLNHSLLVVPPDLEYEAAQITLNREAYDTGNREMNPYAGNVRVLVAPGGYLDTTAWFLLDVSSPFKPIIVIERQAPRLAVVDNELAPDGGNRIFKWHARYNLAYGDWRLAVMGNS